MNQKPFNNFRSFAIFIFLFCFHLTYAQSGGLNNMATRILNTDYIQKTGNNLMDVKGNPFLSENWEQAYIYLTGGGKVYINKAKINGYTGELHYIDEKGAELAPVEGSVSKIEVLDSKDTSKILKKFIAFADQNKNNKILFFEAHNDGAIQIVTRQERFIFTENYDPLKGKTDRYLKTHWYYAIAFNGVLTFIQDIGYDNIIKALPKPMKTENGKKTKLKSIKDAVNFLNQYNQAPE